eukprot:CAMPEP_0171085174 /NCGR_PEP_ID=MMETSP0766_2-20121228/18782_1 /TAXON_ID=439317 /ORGANISM="Gambierdiscus australes, Strain CAWD 149" /LENGTH=108 /DNA_ID=CAMNT_0011542725 /DNA_START=967 /DNA_END=1290 /DNA_ORIENTATION=-
MNQPQELLRLVYEVYVPQEEDQPQEEREVRGVHVLHLLHVVERDRHERHTVTLLVWIPKVRTLAVDAGATLLLHPRAVDGVQARERVFADTARTQQALAVLQRCVDVD